MNRLLASQTILKLTPAVAGLAMLMAYNPIGRSQAQQAPAPMAQPIHDSIPLNLINYAEMADRMLEANRTVDVNGPTMRGQAERPIMEAALESWLGQMLAEKLPQVAGCNMQQRAVGFVAMLNPQTQQQRDLVKDLKTSAQNMSPYNVSRSVLAAWEQVVEQIALTPCAPTPQAPQLATQPGLPPMQAPTTFPEADVQVEAPRQTAPAKRRQNQEMPTRCLGIGSALCEGGLSEAPVEEPTWTAEVSPAATSHPAPGMHGLQAQGLQAGWSAVPPATLSRE